MPEMPGGPGGGAVPREIEIDGDVWIAEVTGRGAAGGPFASGAIESVYFHLRGESVPAVRLAYLPAGRFRDLMDDELRDLQRSAPPLAARPASPAGTEPERAADVQRGAVEDYVAGES